MELRQAVMEINGAVPPVIFTPGRPSGERVGLVHGKDISLRTHHSVTLGAATTDAVTSQVTSSQSAAKAILLTLEIKNPAGQKAALTDIPSKITGNPTREVVFTSEHRSTAWDFFFEVNSEVRQMTLSLSLDYSGLSVSEALAGATFYEFLTAGGEFRIYGRDPVTGGTLSLACADLPPERHDTPEPRLVGMLNDLSLIQDITGVSFTLPNRWVHFQDANTIAATASVLKTGHAQYTAKPWESISNFEQAKSALELFNLGRPAPMALHYEDQVVVIFGRCVPLGPVTLFCDSTYITEEDLEVLRKDLATAVPESSISIRFTPFEECPIEARYLKWLPEDQAASISRLPMYAKNEQISSQDGWTLPQMNASEAVALLKSWYEEDANEQKDSWKRLKVALDEDRLSDRKLFS
jgi:hypothetical protein